MAALSFSPCHTSAAAVLHNGRLLTRHTGSVAEWLDIRWRPGDQASLSPVESGLLVGWLVGLLVGWLVGWFACLLVGWFVCWLVCLLVGWLVGCLLACLSSQQHASVFLGRICTDSFTCCHTEIEVADQTFYHTQSQYTYIGPTSPSADPITPGVWQSSHWSANC